MDIATLAMAGTAVLMGGVLKGAVGAGAPVVAIPILVLLYDVPFAVSLFVLPNLLSNLWQGIQYRRYLTNPGFALRFALSGAAGVGVGSVMLATLPPTYLMVVVAVAVLGYVVFRVLRPGWRLTQALADRTVIGAGIVAGILQGAGGISAPVSITFLNALKLERAVFIASIAVFFVVMSAAQMVALFSVGILTPHQVVLSILASIPLFGGMPIGAWLARHIPAEAFDKVILALLVVIALRLMWGAFA